MNKFIFNLSLFSFALALLFCALSWRGIGPNGDILRLHILANSDSARDQQVKMLVRNTVLECERERLAQVQCREEAANVVMEDAPALLARVEELLREKGCEYGARLSVGVYDFPRRTYGRAVYPAGDYAALRIVLGEGRGQNWWCVLFPPLCILEGPNGEIEYEEDGSIMWKSLLREWREKGEMKDEQAMDESSPAAIDAAAPASVCFGGRAGGGDPGGEPRRAGQGGAN